MFCGEQIVTRHVHLTAEKHAIRYLMGTIDYGLRYISDHEIIFQVYIHSYWAGSVTDWKSTSKCCFSMGSTMISWLSEK
jgi:hypothetical protein